MSIKHHYRHEPPRVVATPVTTCDPNTTEGYRSIEPPPEPEVIVTTSKQEEAIVATKPTEPVSIKTLCIDCKQPYEKTGRRQLRCEACRKEHHRKYGRVSSTQSRFGGNLNASDDQFVLECIRLCKSYTADITLTWNGVTLTLTKQ